MDRTLLSNYSFAPGARPPRSTCELRIFLRCSLHVRVAKVSARRGNQLLVEAKRRPCEVDLELVGGAAASTTTAALAGDDTEQLEQLERFPDGSPGELRLCCQRGLRWE